MESQVLNHEALDVPENVFIKDVITSETRHASSKRPAKKQTRKWAAWTRQEEESFFNALRQVGKNFEKITLRVPSKNKDQVRHYYYRLVRRMNKLLGPELSLDAKNTKDTNTAMLRWWSLLEKHSCKASKLHLKPRRFKMFMEALELQLLKDRKRNIRKRAFHGENSSVPPSNAVSNLALIDNQNSGPAKGSSIRRNATTCLDTVKPARQRRRPGTTSTAAYKKWEKAAIAGVSLVADAAAHLEKTSLDKLVDSMQGDKGLDTIAKDTPPVPAFQQNIQPSMKLKLQLFPINENIRRALEKENHNPHLELTLSFKKRISSVLEHMNRKWGSCSIASGELTLLPYHSQSASCQKWTQDSVLSAADVYAAIGSPPVFRLRYGWFANGDSSCVPLDLQDNCTIPGGCNSGNHDDKLVSPEKVNNIPEASSFKNLPECSNQASDMSQRRDTRNTPFSKRLGGHMEKGSHKNAAVSILEWADSLTNISVSDLLLDNVNSLPSGSQSLQQVPFSCDSFDAAIAAHMSKNLNGDSANDSTVVSSSIWDAEETCDAFTFPKNNTQNSNCIRDTSTNLAPPPSAFEKIPEAEEEHMEVHSMDECDGSAKDLQTLTDMYWPDSLGGLEVDVGGPCRYQSDDLILSDSLCGLTRILSLDAFQNSSFFGLEQREAVGDNRETADPLSDDKIDS